MTPTELREHDAWIAKEVFELFPEYGAYPHYTTDPAASDALDDKILEKLDFEGYEIWRDDGVFKIRRDKNEPWTEHPDKKVCRALFAKKLFEK